MVKFVFGDVNETSDTIVSRYHKPAVFVIIRTYRKGSYINCNFLKGKRLLVNLLK